MSEGESINITLTPYYQGDFVPTSMIFNFSKLSNKSGQTPSNGVWV
jgi:hypothetical protein